MPDRRQVNLAETATFLSEILFNRFVVFVASQCPLDLCRPKSRRSKLEPPLGNGHKPYSRPVPQKILPLRSQIFQGEKVTPV